MVDALGGENLALRYGTTVFANVDLMFSFAVVEQESTEAVSLDKTVSIGGTWENMIGFIDRAWIAGMGTAVCGCAVGNLRYSFYSEVERGDIRGNAWKSSKSICVLSSPWSAPFNSSTFKLLALASKYRRELITPFFLQGKT